MSHGRYSTAAAEQRQVSRDLLLVNEDEVPAKVQPEIEETAARAVASGAKLPLRYIGAGMTGIVFTDRRGKLSFKVARDHVAASMLREEAEWFRTAERTKGVSKHVPGKVHFDEKHSVLIKRLVKGRPGTWGESSKLRDLHNEIERRMVPKGWTSPEFKEDSYVLDEDYPTWYRDTDVSKAKLVDASMAIRVGSNLLKYTYEVLSGRRSLEKDERLDDLAFYIQREKKTPGNRRGTIEPEVAEKAIEKIRQRLGRKLSWE